MEVEIKSFSEQDVQSCAHLAASSSLKDVYGWETGLPALSGCI